jgi:hypothetical protein
MSDQRFTAPSSLAICIAVFLTASYSFAQDSQMNPQLSDAQKRANVQKKQLENTKPKPLLTVCNNPGMEGFLQELKDKKSFSKNWQRRYPVLVFDASATDQNALYWKPAEVEVTEPMTVLGLRGFSPLIYTTENLLVLVCNAKLGDSSSSDESSITVTPGDEITGQFHMATVDNEQTVDRIYLIQPVKDNTLTRVNFYVASPKKDGDAQQEKSGKPVDQKHDTNTQPPNTDVIAWALVERHRMSHYSVGGGAIFTRSSPVTYSGITTPTTITTQTCIAKLTTVTLNSTSTNPSSGYLGSFDPCLTNPPSSFQMNVNSYTYESNITTGTTSGTANYVQGVKAGNWQVDALAGLTVYPLGRDTFPINMGKGFAVPYGFRNPSWNSLGLYIGSSVNNFGTFAVGPAFEFYPGMQLFTGVTMWNKTTLQSSVTACSGYGTSPSFSIPPNSTQYDVSIAYTPATTGTTTTPSNTTIMETKNSITTTAKSGCANGDTATLISGTTAPTQSGYKAAFSMGILFNSNLMKAFSGFFK